MGTATTATKTLILTVLLVSVLAGELKLTEKCAYADLNWIRDCNNNVCEVRFAVHRQKANDLHEEYIGRIDFSNAEKFQAGCATVTPMGQNASPQAYYRIPIMSTDRPNTKPTYPQFPANSYILVPLKNDATVKLRYDNIIQALLNSPLNMDSNMDGGGVIISDNTDGGLVFTLRSLYFINGVDTTAGLTAPDNSCPNGNNLLYRNCGVVHGTLLNNENYTGPRDHFYSSFKINFNLWIMTIVSLLYFIFALGATVHDPLNPHYENNGWFNHPLYSFWVFGNQRQTKVSRLTLLLMSFTAYWLACSIFHWLWQWEDLAFRVLVSAAIGLGFSWIVTRIFGMILMGLNKVHHDFLEEIKKCQTHEEREVCLDRYDNRRLTWNYFYYTLAFAFFCGTAWGTIGINLYFDNTKFWWMMLSIGLCMAADFIIFDMFAVCLGRGNGCLGRWFQNRGYFIDYPLHKNWDQYVSDED
jgi:hypothetical protein